jgi:NADH-quinone oxidoreductase subunit L
MFKEPGLGLELGLMALSVAGAIGSWAIARSRYGADRPANWAEVEKKLPGFTLTQNKYYVDEIYAGSVVKAFMALRLVLADMDTWIVDGLVNGLGVLVRTVAWINGAIDTYLVDGLVNFVAEGTLAAGGKLRTLQTGRIQNYVYGLLGGVAFFAIVQYFFR